MKESQRMTMANAAATLQSSYLSPGVVYHLQLRTLRSIGYNPQNILQMVRLVPTQATGNMTAGVPDSVAVGDHQQNEEM